MRQYKCKGHGRLARWRRWSVCDVGEATEGLYNELWRRWSGGTASISNSYIASPTSQLILQPFRRFIYVTAHSPTLLTLHLRHSSLYKPSVSSPTSQSLHLRHLASRLWQGLIWIKKSISASGVVRVGGLKRDAEPKKTVPMRVRSPGSLTQIFLT